MAFFAKNKLTWKIIGVPIAVALLNAIIFMFLVPGINQRLFDAKKQKTSNLVETAYHLIEHYVSLEKSGKLSKEQAQHQAMEAVRALRYDGKNYFWINDLNSVMLMHPYKRSLEGKNLKDLKDKKGKYIFRPMIKVVKEKGQGFVSYHWAKPGVKGVYPKLSFVKGIPEWGWVVGTGIYVDDVARDMSQLTYLIVGVVLAIFIFAVLASLFLARGIARPINQSVAVLSEGAQQLADASREVANSSASLASGASQLAASLEESSASLEELTSMTTQNAENAGQADSLMKQVSQSTADASRSMQQMRGSMAEISEAGEEISKIIKSIDEIAFQTNLLALNAAVEAARAGEAGAGFAVVADEVRNLAMRAAEAARSTAELIEGTIQKINHGTTLVGSVDESFKEVTQHASKVAELVGEIAAASHEQAQGISQLNQAVSDMDQVTQQNAATAEEAAAAAEELSSQVEEIRSVVWQLKQVVSSSKQEEETASAPSLASKRAQALLPPAGAGKSRPGKGRRQDPEEF